MWGAHVHLHVSALWDRCAFRPLGLTCEPGLLGSLEAVVRQRGREEKPSRQKSGPQPVCTAGRRAGHWPCAVSTWPGQRPCPPYWGWAGNSRNTSVWFWVKAGLERQEWAHRHWEEKTQGDLRPPLSWNWQHRRVLHHWPPQCHPEEVSRRCSYLKCRSCYRQVSRLTGANCCWGWARSQSSLLTSCDALWICYMPNIPWDCACTLCPKMFTGSLAILVSVSVSYCCYNKLSQI